MEFIPFGAADKIKLNIAIVKNFVAVPTKSGATCSDRDAMRFMMLCQAQRLNPFAGDAYLTGYDGRNGPQFSLITAHVAFLKRAESCKDYEGMESGIILLNDDGTTTDREGDFHLENENVVGGWARVHRSGRKPTYRRLSIAQRKPNYDTPFWQGAKAAEQISKCAEADALRATFPTLLGGMHLDGEIVNIESSVVTSKPDVEKLFGKPINTLPQAAPESVESNGDAMRAAMETKSAHHPTQPAPAANEPIGISPAKEAQDAIMAAGVDLDGFVAEIKARNIALNSESWKSWQDVPPGVWETLAGQPKTVAKIVKTFGANK